MRKLLLIAGLAALAIPGLAAAQPGCLQQQHDNRVAGTAVGAEVGSVGGAAVDDAAGAACNGYTPVGYYDDTGVWHAGPGHYDANGDWRSADGSYDRDGNWVDAAPPPPTPPAAPPSAGDYGSDVAYAGPVSDVNVRETALEQRIHEGDASGAISRGDAEHDFDALAGIREFQAKRASADGGLSPGDRADVMNKVDNLSAIVRSQADH